MSGAQAFGARVGVLSASLPPPAEAFPGSSPGMTFRSAAVGASWPDAIERIHQRADHGPAVGHYSQPSPTQAVALSGTTAPILDSTRPSRRGRHACPSPRVSCDAAMASGIRTPGAIQMSTKSEFRPGRDSRPARCPPPRRQRGTGPVRTEGVQRRFGRP